jgi:3-dehydroquinate dehydratase type I
VKLNLEAGPLVAGVLSSLDEKLALAGDLIEVRLDKMPRPADWLERCRAIETLKPVLLTIRLKIEGGGWPEDNEARFKLFEEGLSALSAVDVELQSSICGRVAQLAQKLGKVCVVSHHDFEKTPPLAELERIVDRARRDGAVAKIATMVHSEADAETLRTLLKKRGNQPLCVIGMGENWKDLRVSLTKDGSCLAYGHLDQPTAPGQVSARELVRILRHDAAV